jgi:predicted Zn finger-like uncharacterized protein
VSYIIECPACSTRYKLNKPIPEGGRNVKCARCEHQWLLVPETDADEPLELDDGQAGQHDPAQTPQPASGHEHHDVFSRRTPPQAGSFAGTDEPEPEAPAHDPEPATAEAEDNDWQSELAARMEAHASEPGRRDPFSFETSAPDPRDDEWDDEAYDDAASDAQAPLAATQTDDEDTAAIPAWRARQDRYSAAIPSLSEPAVPDYVSQSELAAHDDPDDDELAAATAQGGETDATGANWWNRRRGRDEPAGEADDAPSGESLQAEPFEAPGFLRDEPEEEVVPQERGGWLSRVMRLGRSRQEEPAADVAEDAAQAEAEDEIRRALDAALEHSGTHSAPHTPQGFSERFSRDDEPEADDDDPYFVRDEGGPQNAGFPLGFRDDGDSGRPTPGRDLDSLSYANMKPEAKAADEDEEDAPFRLTGENARAPVYRSGRLTDEEIAEHQDDRFQTSGFEEDLDQAFGEDHHQPKTSAAPDDLSREDDFEDDFSGLYDRQFARGGSERGPDAALEEDNRILEDDLAELQSELSATDVMAYEREPRSGNLAVIAAWAVFVSVLSGVTLALVSFRQDIMTALPGTTSLYRTIGFDIAHVGVDFADVRYRWATSGGTPMIEVTGQVVNVTGHTVQVPLVLVNVRDSGGGDSVRATASVQTKELAPRESASFSLEFVSPPENVTQIELEFDRSASARP